MKSYANLQVLIEAKTVQRPGVNFFNEHPSQLAELIKKDFDLAELYFKHFEKKDINNITNNARNKNVGMYLMHYTFVKEMLDILLLMSTPLYPNNPIVLKEASLPHIAHERDKIFSLSKDLKHDTTMRNVYCPYGYTYNGLRALRATHELTGSNFSHVDIKTEPLFLLMFKEWQTRDYVKSHLSEMIVKFLGQLEPGNTLNFEFVGQYVGKNDSFQRLISEGYYNVVAALLKSISPELAIQQLQLPIYSLQNKPGWDVLLENLPTSHDAVKQAIACLQDIKFNKLDAFKAFIETPRKYDLLQMLKDKAPTLVPDFCAIAPDYLKDHFIFSAKGLNMPDEKAPPLPPSYAQSMAQQPPASNNNNANNSSSSSSAVSGASMMTTSYQMPVVTNKPDQNNDAKGCRMM
ncbi:MAG: hypothetical protein ACHQAX_02030 [Gammaproteobacteria bacterium]